MQESTYIARQFAARGFVVNSVTFDADAETCTVVTTSGTYVCQAGSDDDAYDFAPVDPLAAHVVIPFQPE